MFNGLETNTMRYENLGGCQIEKEKLTVSVSSERKIGKCRIGIKLRLQTDEKTTKWSS